MAVITALPVSGVCEDEWVNIGNAVEKGTYHVHCNAHDNIKDHDDNITLHQHPHAVLE